MNEKLHPSGRKKRIRRPKDLPSITKIAEQLEQIATKRAVFLFEDAMCELVLRRIELAFPLPKKPHPNPSEK